jgi:precorrin-8X/cobalt-precorrin-8 methylmutase
MSRSPLEPQTSAEYPNLVARYVLPPAEIERRSLATVAKSLAGRDLDEAELLITVRLAYAAGDTALADLIRISPGSIEAGVAALRTGAPVVTDVHMVAAGLDRARLERLGCPILCAIDAPQVRTAAAASGLPRAVEAIWFLRDRLDGAVVTVGNAPSALLALLDLIDDGAARPALIVGTPVGFVAAAESKEELVKRSIPYITLVGTRGGSPLAAAAMNALLRLATEDLP